MHWNSSALFIILNERKFDIYCHAINDMKRNSDYIICVVIISMNCHPCAVYEAYEKV